MASLHAATGFPVADDRRVFATSNHNPFLKPASAPPPPLRPANQAAQPAASLEVTVLWGTSVLAVAQLTPPRAYAVGEVGAPGKHGIGAGKIDFALAAERLGCARREIVALRAGVPFVIFGADETPRVLEQGEAVDVASTIVDCADVGLGARGVELRQDRIVIVETSGVTFRVAGTEKLEVVPRAVLGSADRSSLTALGSAAILQGMLVASLAYFTPSLALADDAELDRERLILMQQYLHAQAERDREQQPQPAAELGGEKGAPAAGAQGPAGKAGRPNAPAQHARMGIKGEHSERIVGRNEQLTEASTFGMIGMLASLNASNAPSSPWGAELALGPDAANGTGELWGDQIGDVAGSGVGLSGTGLSGGGPGQGVGMGMIGTCMGINCYGNGKEGFGRSLARTGPGHTTRGPSIRPNGNTVVTGRLPPDVIQRIVRQNYGRFRACYEVGLRSNPNLEGRVTARFVIGSDGAVSNVSAGGDLPDAQVKSCVASAFYGLSFPTPEGGIVTVNYPIMLTPG
ncbi:MAG TPA: AgmX/PglI C-terminal domain-containing protein [Polyangiaceae bacterium]